MIPDRIGFALAALCIGAIALCLSARAEHSSHWGAELAWKVAAGMVLVGALICARLA
jgi:hypothetical protein